MFQSELSVILSAIAVCVALGIVFYGLKRRAEMMRDLRQLESALADADQILQDYELPSELAEGWSVVCSRLEQMLLIRGAWSKFTRGAIQSETRIGVASSPFEHFNYGLLYVPELHLRRHEATPNQLVGIGLLCTFIGLMLSLWIASDGLEADVEQAKESLIALMGASAIKFVTSIAAIFSALFFTHSKNKELSALHSQIEDFARRLSCLTVSVSPEQIAEESRLELVKQTGLMEVRNEELATAVATQLDNRLRTSLKEALEPIAEGIKGMAERMGEINEAAMRYMVDRFTRELGSAAREHSERMAELLNEVSRAVQGVPDRIEEASVQLSKSIDASAENVEATFGRAGEALTEILERTSGAVKGSASGWADSAAQYKDLTKQLETSRKGFAKQLEAMQKTTDASIESLGGLVETMRTAVASMPALDKTAETLDAASSSLKQVVDEISKIERFGADAQQRALEANAKFLETVDGIEREMSSLDRSMASVFEKTSAGLNNLQGQSEKAVAALDVQMAEAVDRLADAVGLIQNGNARPRSDSGME